MKWVTRFRGTHPKTRFRWWVGFLLVARGAKRPTIVKWIMNNLVNEWWIIAFPSRGRWHGKKDISRDGWGVYKDCVAGDHLIRLTKFGTCLVFFVAMKILRSVRRLWQSTGLKFTTVSPLEGKAMLRISCWLSYITDGGWLIRTSQNSIKINDFVNFGEPCYSRWS